MHPEEQYLRWVTRPTEAEPRNVHADDCRIWRKPTGRCNCGAE